MSANHCDVNSFKALLAQLYWEYRFELRETTKTNGGYRPFSVVWFYLGPTGDWNKGNFFELVYSGNEKGVLKLFKS